MYELAAGPLVWLALAIFLAGVVYRFVELFRLTHKREPTPPCPARGIREDSPLERKLRIITKLQNSFVGQHPVMAIVSVVFHFCLFVAPIFCLAHVLLLRETLSISLFSLPDRVTDILTVIVLLGGLFFLMRRLVVPRVRAISSPQDFVILFITIAPFLTGFAAYHQWGHQMTMVTLHMLSGELMLVAIPFTKLGHMVFFFFVRILLGSEFSLGRGTRAWST